MPPFALLDAVSAALVLGGTILAVILRCGWRDTRQAVGMLLRLTRLRFDAVAAKAQLAPYVHSIDVDGLMRAEPVPTGDEEIDSAIHALSQSRSLKALSEDFEAHRHVRLASSRRAAQVMAAAVELAPVLGLAGTLLALGQLSGIASAGGDYPDAISAAVTTTLYGLLIANFLFAPLEGIIARHTAKEDAARRQLVEWLASHAQGSGQRPGDPRAPAQPAVALGAAR